MAPLLSQNPSNSIFSIRNLVLSIGILFVAIIFRYFIPGIVSGVPTVWTTLGFWFTPPYLYVVVNVIIIAIAASSRFQQKSDEGEMGEVEAPMKVKVKAQIEQESYGGGMKSSEYKTELEGMEQEWYRHELDVKKPKELDVKKPRKKMAEAMEPEMHGRVEIKNTEVKPRKKSVEFGQAQTRVLEVRPRKKVVGFELDVEDMMNKYGRFEAKSLELKKKKMETSAKDGEDEYTHTRSKSSTEAPKPMNSTEIPKEYLFSKEKGHQDTDEGNLEGVLSFRMPGGSSYSHVKSKCCLKSLVCMSTIPIKVVPEVSQAASLHHTWTSLCSSVVYELCDGARASKSITDFSQASQGSAQMIMCVSVSCHEATGR